MIAQLFPQLIELSLVTVLLRLLLAVLCGGAVGLERERKGRPAGFRTHILVCVGAVLCMMTNQYLLRFIGSTDTARLGAGVLTGISFLGAGTIMVTGQRQVKGLTTAAGLWAAAIIGLALGGGFYEGGIFATILILLAELLFSKLEYRMLENAPEINLYMEYTDRVCLEKVLKLFRELNLKILNLEITRPTGSENHNACAIFSLRLNKKCQVEKLLADIHATHGVLSVEEL